MHYITMVKRHKQDGTACIKCRDIEARIKREGFFDLIDRVVVAREGDHQSEGMRLADIYRVARTPFFLVANASGSVAVHTVYSRLRRNVLQPARLAAICEAA